MAVNVTVKAYDAALRAKLILAQPKILATNMALTKAVLEEVAAVVKAGTPLGPGHFGYHGRDTVKVVVTTNGLKVTGKVMAAIQLYWREYGTRGRFRKGGSLARYVRVATQGQGGEPAFMTAHKAATGIKRFANFYYGSLAAWFES